MDIYISEVGGFYTVNLNTPKAIAFTQKNLTVPTYMQMSDSEFYMDTQIEVQDYIVNIIEDGLTVSLNDVMLELDGKTILFAKKGKV